MQIELKPLRCFVMLAQELNFRRAAARLNLSQPALSAQIRGLERQLGFALFDRSTRRVELTRRGLALLLPARQMVEHGARLGQFASQLGPDGRRRMQLGAAFYTIDIPERVALLEGFFDRHPEVALDVSTAYQNGLVAMLQRGEIDAMFLLGLAISPEEYAVELRSNPVAETVFPSDLSRLVLRRERVSVVVPRAMASDGDTLPASALAGRKVAMLGRAHGDALVLPILSFLARIGAEPVVPPESHAIGVERFASQFDMPGISLGWFTLADDRRSSRCRLEGLEIETEFCVARSLASSAPGLELFWEEAQLEGSAERHQALDRCKGSAAIASS